MHISYRRSAVRRPPELTCVESCPFEFVVSDDVNTGLSVQMARVEKSSKWLIEHTSRKAMMDVSEAEDTVRR
jgi:hypothetical protein